LVFFSSRAGNADIWLVDIAMSALMQLTSNRALDINPFFSPDGAYIAFQSDRSGRLEVWVMKSDGSEQRQLTKIGVSGHFLRWSRDGARVWPSGALVAESHRRIRCRSAVTTPFRSTVKSSVVPTCLSHLTIRSSWM